MLKEQYKILIYALLFALLFPTQIFSEDLFEGMENIIAQTVSQTKTEDNSARYKSIPILTFHHIDDQPNSILTSETFSGYMYSIKEAGYETVFYKDLVAFIKGEAELPEKPIIISFDDGYASNYIYAYPLLKKLNMKAEIAVVGYTVGFDIFPDTTVKIIPHFTWGQAKEMVASGHINIHSHSYNLHQHSAAGLDVTRLGVVRREGESEADYIKLLKADAIAANRAIRNNLGYRNIIYTYPYGAYNAMTESVLSDTGIIVTVTNTFGMNDIERGNFASLKLLKRIPCDHLNLNIDMLIEQAYTQLSL